MPKSRHSHSKGHKTSTSIPGLPHVEARMRPPSSHSARHQTNIQYNVTIVNHISSSDLRSGRGHEIEGPPERHAAASVVSGSTARHPALLEHHPPSPVPPGSTGYVLLPSGPQALASLPSPGYVNSPPPPASLVDSRAPSVRSGPPRSVSGSASYYPSPHSHISSLRRQVRPEDSVSQISRASTARAPAPPSHHSSTSRASGHPHRSRMSTVSRHTFGPPPPPRH
ncbi:hypothetical protein F5B22DRAFT_74738 [Xylaria bambusicola]|uniref:uncharacterized protein n=1 Tax=Xylaria bambusicola TaxID=326684 RepID=UPI002007864B|nr:uncharacterized protein F5B22DRAFT_74738 [Xylaria bambusicola]KAI0518175.1 hypothetical protein F5B22DRAFT_74738 [Xylaria bambusicola]